jgi:hypothetical protein
MSRTHFRSMALVGVFCILSVQTTWADPRSRCESQFQYMKDEICEAMLRDDQKESCRCLARNMLCYCYRANGTGNRRCIPIVCPIPQSGGG